jgi:hypothetical protein
MKAMSLLFVICTLGSAASAQQAAQTVTLCGKLSYISHIPGLLPAGYSAFSIDAKGGAKQIFPNSDAVMDSLKDLGNGTALVCVEGEIQKGAILPSIDVDHVYLEYTHEVLPVVSGFGGVQEE